MVLRMITPGFGAQRQIGTMGEICGPVCSSPDKATRIQKLRRADM
jgi:hypothetical protein